MNIEKKNAYPAISAPLVGWYDANHRDLPWRETSDPYAIWVSEIILQQTRVAQGLDYYYRFLDHFPTVKALADAPIDDVLKCWQGLGYYSRARNMHTAAQQIVAQFEGNFPREYAAVLSLKGVGAYTAAAICSFAYQAPYAVVDGNVYRVLGRLFGIDTPIDTTLGKKEYAELAQALLDTVEPHRYNQAIMEFGALQCVPQSPDCSQCPLSSFCVAYRTRQVASFPVKRGKTAVRDRYFYYIVAQKGDRMWLHKRTPGDIWQGLYEFPLIEVSQPFEEEIAVAEHIENLLGKQTSFQILGKPRSFCHQLSHQRIHASFYKVAVADTDLLDAHYIGIEEQQLDNYPISRLTQRYIEKEH